MTANEMIDAKYYAAKLADSLKVAYWVAKENKPFHIRDAHASFLKLAEHMGYNVELKA